MVVGVWQIMSGRTGCKPVAVHFTVHVKPTASEPKYAVNGTVDAAFSQGRQLVHSDTVEHVGD